jgi:hypothetical protein
MQQIATLWLITFCSSVEEYTRLPLQGGIVSQQQEAASKQEWDLLFLIFSGLDYFFTLEKEAVSYSETSAYFYRPICLHVLGLQ